jgi:hypothetical protein
VSPNVRDLIIHAVTTEGIHLTAPVSDSDRFGWKTALEWSDTSATDVAAEVAATLAGLNAAALPGDPIYDWVDVAVVWTTGPDTVGAASVPSPPVEIPKIDGLRPAFYNRAEDRYLTHVSSTDPGEWEAVLVLTTRNAGEVILTATTARWLLGDITKLVTDYAAWLEHQHNQRERAERAATA